MRIALIEGLGSYYYGRHLSKVLETPLREMGNTVITYPWDVQTLPLMDVIIGHSFGAGYAIKRNHRCKLLITLDARRWDFWNNSRLASPSNAGMHVNYYQTSGLRGYPIEGAVNFKTPATSHLGIIKRQYAGILYAIGELGK
jgi:hypothetical protein